MTQPRVKVCCISSVEEAKLAIENGASALGLVGNMPKRSHRNRTTFWCGCL